MNQVSTPALNKLADPASRLLCHCNLLCESDVIGAIIRLRDREMQLITPGLVYRELGTRGRCCGCFRQVVELIHRHVAEADTDPEPVSCACRDTQQGCASQCDGENGG